MSKFTHRVMSSIDYELVAARRRKNYGLFHAALGATNMMHVSLDDAAVPMVYPYMCPNRNLREVLIKNKIFVARYWPNVLEWTTTDDIDYLFASQMQPLPIDQRYRDKEMETIINILKE